MFFVYTLYDYVLGEIEISATLKDDPDPKPYTLRIVTQARQFIGLPFGGGLVKMSLLYDIHGKIIPRSKYSKELKERIRAFKKECPIPYFKLWKGFIYILIAVGVASLVVGVKNNIEANDRKKEVTAMVQQLSAMQPGQLYAVSFFSDLTGKSINGLPEGWIRVVKLDGNNLYVQRSKKTSTVSPVFDMDKLIPILPQSEQDWEAQIEHFDYKLLSEQLTKPSTRGYFDMMYTPEDRALYNGVVLTIKGSLAQTDKR